MSRPEPFQRCAKTARRPFSPDAADWLFSQRHFHFKLLSGTAAGVTVIVLLAGIFLYVTVRNHHQETLRAHTIEVMRLSSLIENDIAALETSHRGFFIDRQAGITYRRSTGSASCSNTELRI